MQLVVNIYDGANTLRVGYCELMFPQHVDDFIRMLKESGKYKYTVVVNHVVVAVNEDVDWRFVYEQAQGPNESSER